MGILKTTESEIREYVRQAVKRLPFDSPEERTVRDIIQNVRKNGDQAICDYTEAFDKVKLSPRNFRMSDKEWENGIKKLDNKIKRLIDTAADRLERFYARTRYNSWFMYDDFGSMLGTRVLPLNTVLVYAPGGKATYPSSVLMGAIPARAAGVREILLTTPARKDGISPAVLYAAKRAGVTSVYKLGGAQAVAGFAFGTETLPRVDKVVGPGNIYVALAKKLLYGIVDIDMVAGPSEVLIIFDATADLEHVAWDMLSQLEHDENAMAVAVTDSRTRAQTLITVMTKIIARSPRRHIIERSLLNSAVIVVDSTATAVGIANEIAPEHLEIYTETPSDLLPMITNAGAVFLGGNTPEAVGDYIAGPNHILPTGGTARFFSPLGVESFLKRMSVLSFTEKGLHALGGCVADFAKEEGLTAHGESVKVRLRKK